MTGAAAGGLSQIIDVETPELVVVSYTIAGVGARFAAVILDSVIQFSILIATYVGILALASRGSLEKAADSRASHVSLVWPMVLIGLIAFAVTWGYFVFFEGIWDGQTPGKRVMRLRVVLDGGYSVTFSASATRNLIRFVDFLPGAYFVGLVAMVTSRVGKRLGDRAAGTIVVREGIMSHVAPAADLPRRGKASAPLLTAALTDEEYNILARYIDRWASLDETQRTRLAAQLAVRLAAPLAQFPTGSDNGRLLRLFEADRTARASGAAGKRAVGAERERHSIVATRSRRWAAFAAVLANAQQHGLSSLGETGVRSFVAEYRALTADLARLRTAVQSGNSDELFYLQRLVAGAHNLIYRRKGFDVGDSLHYLFVEVPAEIRRSWRPIGLAAILLFAPWGIAYETVARHPETAVEFAPPGMIDRADEGAERMAHDQGYVEDPQAFRPLMSQQIITNNLRVTYGVFAFGITLGVGTALMLIFNGIALGGFMGLYKAKGILALMMAFIAPHGVLELSAICISGGGGFLLASAVLIPGQRTRRQAFAENSRRAMRLLFGTTLLLIAAGSLEGMVSPIPYWPLSLKLCVSALTVVALYLYLRIGAGRRATLAATAIPGL